MDDKRASEKQSILCGIPESSHPRKWSSDTQNDQRFHGVSRADVQYDQCRTSFISHLLHHVMNHREKEKLMNELFINNDEANKTVEEGVLRRKQLGKH